MPVSKVELIGGNFQDSEGNLLSGGYLWLKLSQDENVNDSEVCSGVEVKILLDGYGSVIAGQFVWGNDQMLPVNSFYKVTGYTAAGQPAWGPNNQQVNGNGGTYDVGLWVPNQVISWVPPLQPLNLEVNGTPLAAPQTLLNLTNSATVTFINNGGGSISATASGGTTLPAAASGPFFIGPGFLTTQLLTTTSSGINAGWADGIRISRFVLPVGMVIARCSILAQSNSNGFASFGVYSEDGSTKILDSGVFSATGFANPTIFTNTFTPVTIPAGVYWLAQTDSSASGGWTISSFDSGGPLGPLLTGGSGGITGNRGLRGISATTASVGVLPSSISTSLVHTDDDTVVAMLWESQ